MSAKCLALFVILSLPSAAVPLTVRPGDPNWQVFNTDNLGNPGLGSGIGQFVKGPLTPPAGTGSFNLTLGAGAGDQSVQLRTSIFNGTLLSTITSLGYNTFASVFGGSQLPYISLYVDLDNVAGFDDRLVFEPFFSTTTGSGFPHADVVANTWQSWDLMTGNFYSTLSGGSLFTLANYGTITSLAVNATIVDQAPGLGGFRIASGFASNTDVFNTNVDLLTFNGNTYDFEQAVPELSGGSGTLPLAIAGIGMMLLGSRRPRR